MPKEDLRKVAARHIQALPKALRLLLQGLGTGKKSDMRLASNLLFESGFKALEIWDPLEFFGSDPLSFDDYSKAYFPHMDFKNGIQISLNIIATSSD